MKINNLELQNFKFHKELNFNIKSKNCLIYGENGTGKSSIYWSLISIFKKDLVNISDFKNRDMSATENLNVIIKLDNGQELNLEEDNTLIENNRKTIFFAHQDMLEEFLVFSDNFFDVLNNKIKRYFTKVNSFSIKLDKFNDEVDDTNHIEKTPLRVKLTEEYERFLNQLLLRTNDIIINHFNEVFTVHFDYDWGQLNLISGDYYYIAPKIVLKIENQSKLKLQFNEAKLKLVSIALFFALIKLEEDESNLLKLLVLDDFLTSLDMANRKLIVQYILENFGDYQKIILTHNIQFYNLIIKLLKLRKKDNDKEELTDWDIKNIFIQKNNNEDFSNIIDKEEDYLKKAKTELDNYELAVSGNFLRKEFERILNEFEHLLEIGRVEDLDKVIKALKNLDYLFPEPNKNLTNIIRKFNNIINNPSDSITDNDKYIQLKEEIETLPSKLSFRNDKLVFLKQVILKTEFYKDILMNASSHDDTERELYSKEFQKSIELLKKLKNILKNLK